MPAAKVFGALGGRLREIEVEDSGEQFDRQLDQDPGTVTAVRSRRRRRRDAPGVPAR